MSDKYLAVLITENPDNKYEYTLKIFSSIYPVSDIDENTWYTYVSNFTFNTSELNDLVTATITIEHDSYNFQLPADIYQRLGIENSNDQDIFKNQIIYSFTDDSINLYHYVKELYEESKYGKIESIYTEIFKALYNCIKEDEQTLDCLYIPCIKKDGTEYEISYTYNTNKPEIIYFAGKELEVVFVGKELTSDWFNLYLDEYRDNIIAHTEKFERTSFYYFETSIDPETELVNEVYARKLNTLPYIDDNGYWIIDDRNTGIYARGKSAGNPNIIIVETTNNAGGYRILAGAKKQELLEELTWDSKIALVEPLERINLDSISFKNEYDYFKVNCSIPSLDKIPEIHKEDYLALLENSLIINISPISCIVYNESNINYTKDDVIDIYGEYGVITTIWTLDDEKVEYDYLRKRNNKLAAADFNYLSNINNLIQHAVKNAEQLHPDNYEFTNLVFDSTYSTLKNNTSEVNTYIYPNLINKKSSDYFISNYNNDINFTFKANNILSKNGDNITGLSQSGNLRFFNSTYNDNTSSSSNVVTNALYEYYKDGVSGRFDEYIPNYNVPSLDLSEVLTRNETLLNRLNILSFNNKGTAYLSYIGTSIDENKNVLTIGTSTTNINMGTDTLLHEADRDSFIKQNKLAVDFEKININGDTTVKDNLTVNKNIYLSGDVWSKNYLETITDSVVSDITYYTAIVTPTARYIYELNDNFSPSAGIVELYPSRTEYNIYTSTVSSNDNGEGTGSDEGALTLESTVEYTNIDDANSNMAYLLNYSLYNYSVKNNKLFVISTVPEYYKINNSKLFDHKIYFSDGIYLPVLLTQIGLESFINSKGTNISLPNVTITSNMDIISVNNSPILLLSSSTNLYPDKYLYQRINTSAEDNTIESIANFTYTVFTGNPLKITYYIIGNKLYIHIEELYSKNKFIPLKKLKTNYII